MNDFLTGERHPLNRYTSFQLKFTSIYKNDNPSVPLLVVNVLSWGFSDSLTILDPLPINIPPDEGLYGNFKPWNLWLGEQLMYAQAKLFELSREETFELTLIANIGARSVETLWAAALPLLSEEEAP